VTGILASNPSHAQIYQGYAYAAISAILFGSVATVSKASLLTVNPLVLSATVYLVSSAVLFPLAYRSKSLVTLRDLGLVVIIAVFGAALAPALYFYGLQNSTAANATLLSNGEIVFSILLATLFFKEKIRPQGYPAIALVIAGLILVTTNFEFNVPEVSLGNLLLLSATIFWAIDNNISRAVAGRISAAKLAQIKSLIGSALLSAVILSMQIPVELDITDVPLILILGIFGFALSLYFFIQSLRLSGTINTILIFSLSSPIGLVFAWLFLQETITIWQIMASGLMLVGIYLLTRKEGLVTAFR
jgi:drug/metabolite transporter (DMT)-like permease